jgi:hypothetical protein
MEVNIGDLKHGCGTRGNANLIGLVYSEEGTNDHRLGDSSRPVV